MTYLTSENRSLLVETIFNICRRAGDAINESLYRETLEKLPDAELERELNKVLAASR